jgi:hypothetical protein
VLECDYWKVIDFEDLQRGDKVTDQYKDLATFAIDADRMPLIYDDASRPANAQTQSPHNSVTNFLHSGLFRPMSISFTEPQQEVSLYVGRTSTGLASDGIAVLAVLEAFDLNDLSMEPVRRLLPAGNYAINKLLRAAAIFPDMPIKRVEIRYEIPFNEQTGSAPVPIAEPQQIDDLKLCFTMKEEPVGVVAPRPPTYGNLPAVLTMRAVVVTPTGAPVDREADHASTVETVALGVPLKVDSSTVYSGNSVSRPEGSMVHLAAPAYLGPDVEFRFWRYNSGVNLGKGNIELDMALVRSASITAVYFSRKPYIPREPGDDTEQR